MSDVSYQDSPAPLTDRERSQLKRMFSDYFEVPGEWKGALRADLERDPPVLGSQALGGQSVVPKDGSVINASVAAGANIDLSKLAPSGQIGNTSFVEVLSAAIRLGGDVVVQRTATNRLDVVADTLRLGATNDLDIKRGAAGRLDIVADNLRLGASGDIDLQRTAADRLDLLDVLRITISSASAVLAPLWLNINGTVLQVQVGPAGSGPGGVGRALFVT
jgi:hypothetical protein